MRRARVPPIDYGDGLPPRYIADQDPGTRRTGLGGRLSCRASWHIQLQGSLSSTENSFFSLTFRGILPLLNGGTIFDSETLLSRKERDAEIAQRWLNLNPNTLLRTDELALGLTAIGYTTVAEAARRLKSTDARRSGYGSGRNGNPRRSISVQIGSARPSLRRRHNFPQPPRA
jgi:hypothetical protein